MKNWCGNNKKSKVTPHNDKIFKQYNHDIINMKKLNEHEINNINNMTDREKIEIIKTFNEVILILRQNLETYLEDNDKNNH
jgi:hypothetical protein